MTIPIAASPGRAGFGPVLALSYDSGGGNGPFGLGWGLSLPAITRTTDRGLPRYLDAEESDTFVLSGAEDLVPVMVETADGWKRHADTRTHPGYVVERYRPRVEGLFARIERWTDTDGDVHWRATTRDNVTTLYGQTEESRIADPADRNRVFSWLIAQSFDDKGNAMVFDYAREDSRGIATSVHERNRTDESRSAKRYPKRIRYGNATTSLGADGTPGDPAAIDAADWLFELVFDYGEGHYTDLAPDPAREPDRQLARVRATNEAPPGGPWPVRPDPLSTYRPGFEVRTYRRCQRVLMFHHFPDRAGVETGYDGLVGSTDFDYHDRDTSRALSVADELEHDGSTRYASVLASVSHAGYRQVTDGTYIKQALPPLEFGYSRAVIDEDVQDVEPDSLEDLPAGLGSPYQWTDLDGEGLSGILTEQAGGWFYKRNLSPSTYRPDGPGAPVSARFSPAQTLSARPSTSQLGAGTQQLLDLAGDGRIDLVQLDPSAPGFYERDREAGWARFEPFESIPSLRWDDPNLRFVDLTGDGHADVMLTEDDAFTWHRSLAKDGFGPAQRARQHLDEEHGPRLVFGDGTGSVHLADLSGDGLSDLVRIRNGEICYWPNLGYGRFGAKVSMDNGPWFDRPDRFDQRRIRLADIDGSGVTDIIYLGDGGVQLYFNQSGNAWSDQRVLRRFPPVDDLSSVSALDLLGTGTACLAWSSPLPSAGRRSLRYIDLMSGGKPHLLVRIRNNLGAETHLTYAPSTRFYLEDERAGTPWVTRLPFPVHCLAKTTVTDRWRKTSFSSSYSYHHGYFDGAEREFRGFGRVEQVDVESYGQFEDGNPDSPYITEDRTLYQPPVKTVTWFHTGAFLGRDRMLSQFRSEYFPHGLAAGGSEVTGVVGSFREHELPEPNVEPGELAADEWTEALRACKGMMLRQEVYELDVDALEHGEHRPVRLFSTAFHNCHVRRLQPRTGNRHAVFLVTESEAITYQYELDLRPATVTPDPRVAHTLNLAIDEYGNVLQSVAAVYPRLGRHTEATLPDGAEELIAGVQNEPHVGYTETRYTDDEIGIPHHRLRVPCEVTTYELTRITPAASYFTLAELRGYRLSETLQADGVPVAEIPYHQTPLPPESRGDPERRAVERVRMLFFHADLATPLPFGTQGPLGLAYETYKLALTDDLLDAVLGARVTGEVARDLGDPEVSGYLSGLSLVGRFDDPATAGQYWVRSGTAGYADDAAAHFFLPEHYTDPFGQQTTLTYDAHDLYVESSVDPVGNTVTVEQFDHRVLAPRETRDINGNLTEVAFDVLGRPTAMAVKGGGTEADSVAGLTEDIIDLDLASRRRFFTGPYLEDDARDVLRDATARHVYYLGEELATDGSITYANHPPCAAGIMRERHADPDSPVHTAFEYSDGLGATIVTKSQAEPASVDDPLPWIASSKTILNNKGKPVKQYEPYFSESEQRFEEPRAVGVTSVLYYDAAGRTVRTEMPDGSFSRVEFSPWHLTTYDQNDTVLEPENLWFARHTDVSATPAEREAARLAAAHHDTPAQTFLDSLGREVIGTAHNRVTDAGGGPRDEKYLTYTRLDAEGKPLWIRDARHNLVMQYVTPPAPNDEATGPALGFVPCYDIAGNLLFQHSMDAGDRWVLTDSTGQPFYGWDVNDRVGDDGIISVEDRAYRTTYDALRRPVSQQLRINGGRWQTVERFEYGDDPAVPIGANRRGEVHRHWDPSGLMTNQSFDFKGNLLEVTRQLTSAYTADVVDWSDGSPTPRLDDETFTQITEYDALNRMTRLYNWHNTPDRVAVYEPAYSERGLLRSEDLTIGAQLRAVAGRHEHSGGNRTTPIAEITYDAKGQRTSISHGNGAITRFDHDPETFRLRQLRTTRPGHNPPFPDHRSALADERVLQQLSYTYDPVGNITEIYDEAYEPVFFRNQMVEPRSVYEYDPLYRLTKATGRESATYVGAPPQLGRDPVDLSVTDQMLRNYEQRYRYDPAGNIDQMRHVAGPDGSWTRHYEYAPDSNRLLRTWTGGDATTAVPYRYDLHGSMLNLNRVPDEFLLRWDHRDMIHTANLGGGGFAYYNYDASKQRTRKVITSRTGVPQWERLYLGGMEVYRRFGPGGVVELIETHHLVDGDQRVLLVEDVVATERPSGPRTLHRYQLSDHLGSSHIEIDHTAAVISYETYHPYGTSAYRAHNATIEVSPIRYRYTGMERDDETGLNYHTARYYVTWMGRWCSADPIGPKAGPNAYAYGLGSPINLNDPSGLQPPTRLSEYDPRTHTSGGEVPPDLEVDAISRAAPHVEEITFTEDHPVRARPREERSGRNPVPDAANMGSDDAANMGSDIVFALLTSDVLPSYYDYARRGSPEFSGAFYRSGSASGRAYLEHAEHQNARLERQTAVAGDHLAFHASLVRIPELPIGGSGVLGRVAAPLARGFASRAAAAVFRRASGRSLPRLGRRALATGASLGPVQSETTGGLTNLGRAAAISRNGGILDQYRAGDAFSGVYDSASGNFLAYRSLEQTRPLLPNTVIRRGGHGAVSGRLSRITGSDPEGHLGFTVRMMEDGSLGVSWLSRSVNGPNPSFPGVLVPARYQRQILDALSAATGRTVRSL